MDATEKKMFRKSVIGGFSKEDVNNYIVEISEKQATEIKELKEKCSAAEEKNRELSEELSELKAKLSELSRDSAELSELKEKHAELSSAYEAKSSEASAASAKNSELEARVGSLSSIEKEYVARKTELADIEISARGRANSIISDAEAAAAAIRRELERELAEK